MTGEAAQAPTGEVDRIARGYRRFAEVEAAPVSPRYAELATAVATDDVVLRFLADLPPGKRQPNLLFAALQFLDGIPADGGILRQRVRWDGDRLRATMLARATQTNEPARCAALLPLLDLLEGPLALIEVGAAAGLCLYPDRYRYEYDGKLLIGPDSPVRLTCRTAGEGPLPRRVPEVAARIGIDLNPLDVADADDRAWLRALVWPGPQGAARLTRLDAAAEVVRREPAHLLTGDLLDRLQDALALVPDGCTPVVFHTAVLVYLPRARRASFVDAVGSAAAGSKPVRWIVQEGPDVLPELTAGLSADRKDGGGLVLALDGRALARTAPHGGWLEWAPAAAELRT